MSLIESLWIYKPPFQVNASFARRYFDDDEVPSLAFSLGSTFTLLSATVYYKVINTLSTFLLNCFNSFLIITSDIQLTPLFVLFCRVPKTDLRRHFRFSSCLIKFFVSLLLSPRHCALGGTWFFSVSTFEGTLEQLGWSAFFAISDLAWKIWALFNPIGKQDSSFPFLSIPNWKLQPFSPSVCLTK